jgi:hypothetical protein
MEFKPTVGNKLYERIMRINSSAGNRMDEIFQSAFARSNKRKDWALHNLIDGEVICVALEILRERK